MAQVSYGTITITDTTDLTTYIRYATKAPLTAASQFQETPTTDTRYIAVLSIPTSDSIPAWNSSSWKWSEFIGTDGLSVKDTRVLYYLKTNSANVPQVDYNTSIVSTDTQNAWTSKNPTYVVNGTYWTCLEVTLSDNTTKSWSAPAEDLGLTQAAKDAAETKSIAQQTIEDAQGALSIATGINQHFFSIPNDYSASVPAGSYITEINVDTFKQSPSGGNLLTRSDGVWLRNGADILASLQGTGLTFLIPTGTYKGRKSLEILGGTTPALKLYDAQNNNAVATLDSNGLVLSRGGITVNTVGSNNGVYVSSENLGSKVASLVNDDNKTNWRAVIGSKFGVDSEGNLYANEAHISGEITASKLTISSNTTISDTSGLISNSAVEIGGRNLLYNSGTMPVVSSDNKGWRASGGTVSHIDISTLPIAGVSGGIRCTNTGSSAARIGIAQDLLANRFIAGKKYSMGCWIRASAEFSSDVTIQPIWISSSQTTNSKYISMTLNTNWQYISAEGLVLNGDQASSYSAGYVYASNVPVDGYIEVCGIMLEEGTKCTSWTPAPEDVDGTIYDTKIEVLDNLDDAEKRVTKTANSALGKSSIVEDVVDTLTWLAKYGKFDPTNDDVVQQNKIYYTRSGAGTDADPYTYEVVIEPEEDPKTAGYYELTRVDEVVSNYVASHLELIPNEGLYVVNDDTAGKVLLSTNGVELINERGETVATYGTNTVIGDEESVHLKIEATELGFYDGDERVAYISNNELYIPRVVVVDSMQVGNRADGAWQWVVDDDSRNLRLMWIGG